VNNGVEVPRWALLAPSRQEGRKRQPLAVGWRTLQGARIVRPDFPTMTFSVSPPWKSKTPACRTCLTDNIYELYSSPKVRLWAWEGRIPQGTPHSTKQ